jgi:hypothetical protein
MVEYKALTGLSLLRVPHFRTRHGASLKVTHPDTTSMSITNCFLSVTPGATVARVGLNRPRPHLSVTPGQGTRMRPTACCCSHRTTSTSAVDIDVWACCQLPLSPPAIKALAAEASIPIFHHFPTPDRGELPLTPRR